MLVHTCNAPFRKSYQQQTYMSFLEFYKWKLSNRGKVFFMKTDSWHKMLLTLGQWELHLDQYPCIYLISLLFIQPYYSQTSSIFSTCGDIPLSGFLTTFTTISIAHL